jgi:hypothetical protein
MLPGYADQGIVGGAVGGEEVEDPRRWWCGVMYISTLAASGDGEDERHGEEVGEQESRSFSMASQVEGCGRRFARAS